MNDAPERIWVWYSSRDKQDDVIQAEVEYIRADLALAAPVVTDAMVEAAWSAFVEDEMIIAMHVELESIRAALTAALAQMEGKE